MTSSSRQQVKILDCTLRDGGYYTSWDFDSQLVQDYLQAMAALNVGYVEVGFRSLQNSGFKGAFAYSTDAFLQSLTIPSELNHKIGVMVNGYELSDPPTQRHVLERLFLPKSESPVSLVRIACHIHELESCLPATHWLHEQGYRVGVNIMQVSDCSPEKISGLAKQVADYPVDVLYFADSMGSLQAEQTQKIVDALRENWAGELGIHTHDNMCMALGNTLSAVESGVTWVDCTVTGMGRGPGNLQTEYAVLALEKHLDCEASNPTKLLGLIREHFSSLKNQYGWGTNPYYYLAGEYGIHPSYVQEMLADRRYSEEDILAVLEHLKIEGGKKFNLGTLEAARHFYSGLPRGQWNPKSEIENREVLILGTGPGVSKYRQALEAFVSKHRPFVIALNTQQNIDENLIDVRAACHPVRLLADCQEHRKLSQPLVTPASMLPEDVKQELKGKELLDFGISVDTDVFEFNDYFCILPSSLVLAYALAIATSGHASRILLAGFDGYDADDPRRKEIDRLFQLYAMAPNSLEVLAITPTRYEIPVQSVYAYEIKI
ncbi:aldolase catalytic domain-containing protein [Thiomicrorhabdus chilensis]|uniref:aldolase catalytic domain-containing protein n=1 Tax=Thiomicrorhabdus chilensis TaxID=63656 RepID=UPI00048D7976|nr:aldolase catalytic domain-containing protein [Thiomicrorhabdus chilensis]